MHLLPFVLCTEAWLPVHLCKLIGRLEYPAQLTYFFLQNRSSAFFICCRQCYVLFNVTALNDWGATSWCKTIHLQICFNETLGAGQPYSPWSDWLNANDSSKGVKTNRAKWCRGNPIQCDAIPLSIYFNSSKTVPFSSLTVNNRWGAGCSSSKRKESAGGYVTVSLFFIFLVRQLFFLFDSLNIVFQVVGEYRLLCY